MSPITIPFTGHYIAFSNARFSNEMTLILLLQNGTTIGALFGLLQLQITIIGFLFVLNERNAVEILGISSIHYYLAKIPK